MEIEESKEEIMLPLVASEEIKYLCKETGIMLPKQAPVTTIMAVDGEDSSKISYMDESKLFRCIAHSGNYSSRCFESPSISRDYMRNGEFNRFFDSKEFTGIMGWVKEWVIKSGIKTKPGRLLKKILPKLDNPIIEKFSSKFVQEATIEIRDNVSEIYEYESVKSCMIKRPMDFYEKNGVKIVAGMLRGTLAGRALLWPDIYFPSLDKTLWMMDRIFDKDGRFKEQMLKFGVEQGFVVRLWDKGDDWFSYKGKSFQDKIQYKIKDWNVKLVPYLDTFHSADKIDKNTVILINDTGTWALRQHGTDAWNPLLVETVLSKRAKKEIPKEGALYLKYLDDWAKKDEAIKIKTEYYLREDCTSCNCGNYTLKNDSLWDIEGQPCCKTCRTLLTGGAWKGNYAQGVKCKTINKKVVHKDDPSIVTIKGKSHLIEDPDVYFHGYEMMGLVCKEGSIYGDKMKIVSSNGWHIEKHPVFFIDCSEKLWKQ